MEQIHYFNTPTQVMFVDFEEDEEGNEEVAWCAGIAYKDEIICACCGSTFNIADLYEYAPKSCSNPIYIYSDWVDIEEEIVGGELPEGLTYNERTNKVVEIN